MLGTDGRGCETGCRGGGTLTGRDTGAGFEGRGAGAPTEGRGEGAGRGAGADTDGDGRGAGVDTDGRGAGAGVETEGRGEGDGADTEGRGLGLGLLLLPSPRWASTDVVKLRQTTANRMRDEAMDPRDGAASAPASNKDTGAQPDWPWLHSRHIT